MFRPKYCINNFIAIMYTLTHTKKHTHTHIATLTMAGGGKKWWKPPPLGGGSGFLAKTHMPAHSTRGSKTYM